MATIIRMPEVLANSSEAAIQTWLVTLGQDITVGVPLAEVETEKAIVEYAAETAGTVLKLLVDEGVSVKVGDPIAIVGAQGESVGDLPGSEPDAAAAAPSAAPEPETAPEVTPSQIATAPVELSSAPDRPATERQFISPLVRRLAKERSLDLSAVTGTGPGGRIVRADLARVPATAAAPAPTAPAPAPTAPTAAFTDTPHTGMRRAIARRLTESKSTIPHFYLVADCRVDALLELRRTVNEHADVKISVNDFVVKAAAAAFRKVPEANAIWTDGATRHFDDVDIAIAVSIDGGLVTPVVRAVDKRTLSEVSQTIRELASRGREGRLKQNELEGGAFSVSNLGMYGTQEFSAIINPPQSGILAVGAATQRPIVVDGELAVATVMTVTLSADHRVLDGALAAQWLAAFVACIESPTSMLI